MGVRHEDARKYGLLAAILAAKEQVSGNFACLQWRTFAADIMAVRLQNSNDATMCAIIAQFIRDLLDFAGLSSNLAYITSVFIGYIGTDSIGSLIKRFATKSRSRRWQEINNHQRRSSTMLAWSEELITDVRKTRNHGYDVIVGGELFTDYSRSPSQTCHAKPKTFKSTGAGRYQLLSRWWDAYRKQLGLKDFSPKSQTLWHCSRLRSVALYL